LTANPYSLEALRDGAWHYLTGRAVTAALTFTIQLTLVRLLAIDAYGQYAALLASFELALVLAAFGLNWGAVRYVPEYRLKGTYAQTRRFIDRLLRVRVAGLLGAAALWLVLSPWALPGVGGDDPWAVRLMVAALIVMEGLSLFVRDCLLGTLLQQKAARTANVARQLCWVALLGAIAVVGQRHLFAVLVTELAASALGLVIGVRGLREGLRQAMADARGAAGWAEPSNRDLWAICSRIYASDLLSMVASGQTLAILTQRIAGNEVAAVYGFLRVLLNKLSRYLPASLLFSLIQPKLTASYVEGGGMPALARNANLVGKTSLLALMPVIITVAIAGDEVMALLSGQRFTGTGWLLAIALIHMIPGSQGLLLFTVAVVAGRPGLPTIAMATSLIALPIAWVGFQLGWGVWAPVVAQLVSSVVIVGTLMVLLSRHTAYSARGSGMASASGLALLAMAPALVVLVLMPGVSLVERSLLAAAGVLLFALMVWFLRIVGTHERETINRLVGRRILPV
jgi:O-antigen/teichoic acid export membrane protein